MYAAEAASPLLVPCGLLVPLFGALDLTAKILANIDQVLTTPLTWALSFTWLSVLLWFA